MPSPPGGDARVVGGAAADQQKTSTPPNFWHKGLDSAQDNTLCLEVDLGLFSVRLHIAHLLTFWTHWETGPAPHCVHHRLRLFADLLLHESRVAALHDLLDLHLESDDLPALRRLHLDAPADPVDGEGASVAHRGHVVVLQVDHLDEIFSAILYLVFDHPVGVFHDGAGVAGEEVLGHVVLAQGSELGPAGVPTQAQHGVVAPPLPAVVDRDVVGGQLVLGKDADQQRRTSSSGNHLTRIVSRLEDKSKSTFELLTDQLNELAESDVLVLGKVVEVQDQLGDHLCVCLRLKYVAFLQKEDLWQKSCFSGISTFLCRGILSLPWCPCSWWWFHCG